jgi:hypothetical protein
MDVQQAQKMPLARESPTRAPAQGSPPGSCFKPRAEERRRLVRSLEYSLYPRKAAQENRLTGLSRDESSTGLCAVVDRPEARGSLLQVGLHDLDGNYCLEALALVVWCRARQDGRYAMGLSFLANSIRTVHAARSQHSASWATGSTLKPI